MRDIESKMNCRLCDKDINCKKGSLLYDYEDNVETLLGRKVNIIVNSSENNDNLSNYCCDSCSIKVEVCFSLLVGIKASHDVIKQTYENLNFEKNINFTSQLFICQECHATVLGMKLFIKHHENHIIKKTTLGSVKDIPLSSAMISKCKQKVGHSYNFNSRKSNRGLRYNKLKESFDSLVVDKIRKESMEENNIALNKNSRKNAKSFKKMKSNCSDDDDDDNDEEEKQNFGDYDFEDFDDLSHWSDLDYQCDIAKNSTDESTIFDDHESEAHFSENDNNGNAEGSMLNFLKKNSESQNLDALDADSNDSISSEISFQNLLHIVKNELVKSDDEESISVEPNENGKYSCDICKISFDFKFILKLHLEKNHEEYHDLDASKVKECSRILESDFASKCFYCKKSIGTSELRNHLLECRERLSINKSILCQVCGKMCSFRTSDKHMKEHKKMEDWACELCDKKFKAKRFLKSHLGEHDESKKKMCEICGKKLLPLSFFSHIMKHREKRHVCQYCGKAFTYNYGLRIHMKTHDISKKLDSKPEKKKDKVFCWLCKKDFSCTVSLNKHLKNDHDAEGVEQNSRFPCSQCEKKFADMFSLKAHLKLIHEMKDEEIARLKSLPVYRYIECNVCNKVFNSENKIRIHMKQDHGLKPFEMEILKKECEKCGKKFASKQNLIHHINGAHLNIKPMTCDICQEKFAKHSSLIYHKLRHSGEKPFQCEFCHKSYRQRNDVIRHLARHVRDKELTLEEASAVNNSPSRLVIKRRIFLKDSSINYQTIVRKNRQKSEVIEMEPILEDEVNEIQEEQMEFIEDGIAESMIYVEEVPVDENQTDNAPELHYINAKPVYNEERNTIILSSPDVFKNSIKNITCRYVPSQLKQLPAVIVKKEEQI